MSVRFSGLKFCPSPPWRADPGGGGGGGGSLRNKREVEGTLSPVKQKGPPSLVTFTKFDYFGVEFHSPCVTIVWTAILLPHSICPRT